VQALSVAQEVKVPLISGSVMVDGRPIDRMIEVRLEAQDYSIVATAYTRGDSRFIFGNVILGLDKQYFLIIRDPDFRDLRYQLNSSDFIRDSSNADIYHFGGLVILELESLPPDDAVSEEQRASPKAVGVRQLKSRVSDEAQREFDLAMKDIAAGNSESALLHLENAVKLTPDYYDALNKLGVHYIRAAQYRDAETVLERAHRINPKDPLPLTNLGILHLQEGEQLASSANGDAQNRSQARNPSYLKAADAFEEAMRLDPLAPRTFLYLATTLYRVGSYERAESLLMNALALDNAMHEARLTLVSIYVRQRRYRDALKQISLYLQAVPDAPERVRMEALRNQIEGILDE
jgi:Flp pilus assembly protein TadD